MKKEEEKKYSLILSNGYIAQEIIVTGMYSEAELKEILSRVGRDFVYYDMGSSYNLKFFSNIVVKEVKE